MARRPFELPSGWPGFFGSTLRASGISGARSRRRKGRNELPASCALDTAPRASPLQNPKLVGGNGWFAPVAAIYGANHLGYTDIVMLAAAAPVVFVSKSEVRRWPVLGSLATCAGTLFLNRERKEDLLVVSRQFEPIISTGIPVVVFLEGTSSNGDTVLPFRPPLLAPAVQETERSRRSESIRGHTWNCFPGCGVVGRHGIPSPFPQSAGPGQRSVPHHVWRRTDGGETAKCSPGNSTPLSSNSGPARRSRPISNPW